LTVVLKFGEMVFMPNAKLIHPKEAMTTPQACEFLGITRQTLYSWLQQGKIKPWMKVGGASWLFIQSEVEKLKDAKYNRNHNGSR